MTKRINGFEIIDSPFTIEGVNVPCRVLSSEQHDYFFKHNIFNSVWDDEECEVGLVVKEISEYETEEIFYIYYFEG